MIHQLIFAGPKPGLTPEAFQSHWINFHEVDYAAKIPQIRRYLVAPRDANASSRAVPFFEGVAEIWLKNDEEKLASLQTPEFLQGARQDEPRWAAFWATFVHDGDPEIVKPCAFRPDGYRKLYVFLKRRNDIELAGFRSELLGSHSSAVLTTPSILGYIVAFARPGAYQLSEPRFDAIEIYCFNGAEEVGSLLSSNGSNGLEKSWCRFCNTNYLFTFTGREHWVIPPGQRDAGLIQDCKTFI